MSSQEPGKEEEKKVEEGAPAQTETKDAETGATEEKGKKGKEKKEKKKKLSKKEIARRKKEQAEQERIEAEAKARELQKQKEIEMEAQKRKEQQARLDDEKRDIEQFRKDRIEKIKLIVEERERKEDWDVFSSCDHSIDVRSEADVNTFIEQWSEINETDLSELTDHIKQSEIITNKLIAKSEMMQLTNELSKMERCNKQIKRMRELIVKKIDSITAHIMAFSDKLKESEIYTGTDEILYGMWVNVTKNPRTKLVEPCNGVSIEIANSIAMYNLAIRAIRFNEDIFDDKYLFIDKLFQCDFLQLQAPAKKIGTMTIRQPPHSSSLQKIVYPLKGSNKPCPPLVVRMQLDESSLNEYCNDATIVMINKDGDKDEQVVSDCSIQDSTVKFTTAKIGTFGLAVPRYKHFPFQFWEISGLSPTSVEIYLQTTILELALVINGDGLVSMESPFKFENLTPIAAMKFLESRGVNLTAPAQIEGIKPKDPKVEKVLNYGIADCAVGFDVRSSKHNSSIDNDRALLLVRQKTNYDEETTDEKDEQNIKESHAILVKEDHVTEDKNQEFEDTYVDVKDKQGDIHQHLLPMFFDFADDKVKENVRNAPPLIFNAVLFFMERFRLFSMTN